MTDAFASAVNDTITIEFDAWNDLNRHHILGITALTQDCKVYLLALIDDSTIPATGSRITTLVTQTIAGFMPTSKILAIVSAADCRSARASITSMDDYRDNLLIGALHMF